MELLLRSLDAFARLAGWLTSFSSLLLLRWLLVTTTGSQKQHERSKEEGGQLSSRQRAGAGAQHTAELRTPTRVDREPEPAPAPSGVCKKSNFPLPCVFVMMMMSATLKINK